MRGRTAERTKVSALLTAAATGPAALVIEGDAGIGKTMVWSSAIDEAYSRGFNRDQGTRRRGRDGHGVCSGRRSAPRRLLRRHRALATAANDSRWIECSYEPTAMAT